ncbi:hypothetical protein P9112_003400 [Eukaryota sp. TZLM1-RC]
METSSLLTSPSSTNDFFYSHLPKRMDRLPFRKFHVLVALALGISWTLDGLAVSHLNTIAPILEDLWNLTDAESGTTVSIYLVSCVIGSLSAGSLIDAIGKKRLYRLLPTIFVTSMFVQSISKNILMFNIVTFFIGLSLGGEYILCLSSLSEFIPARNRGALSMIFSSCYWLGSATIAAASLILFDERYVPHKYGFRIPFLLSGVFGIFIIFLRSYIPESPRWLLSKKKFSQAEDVVKFIESKCLKEYDILEDLGDPVKVYTRKTSMKQTVGLLFKSYKGRAFLSAVLMISQAFVFNSIFATFTKILKHEYGVPEEHYGYFLIPFSVINFLGSSIIGSFIDKLGRKFVITSTFGLAGGLLIGTGYLYYTSWFTATTQTIGWVSVFFFASAAASSAYLSIAELFPAKIRASSIAFMYSLGTLCGAIGPILFGRLLDLTREQKDRKYMYYGYLIAGGGALFASVCEIFLGVSAEGKSLEELEIGEDGSSEEESEGDVVVEDELLVHRKSINV